MPAAGVFNQDPAGPRRLDRPGDRKRGRNRHLLPDNSRFPVLPWAEAENLASCALGMAARQLPGDRERIRGCRPAMVETFIEESRFRGSPCRAAGWTRVGETGGRGKPAKGPASCRWRKRRGRSCAASFPRTGAPVRSGRPRKCGPPPPTADSAERGRR